MAAYPNARAPFPWLLIVISVVLIGSGVDAFSQTPTSSCQHGVPWPEGTVLRCNICNPSGTVGTTRPFSGPSQDIRVYERFVSSFRDELTDSIVARLQEPVYDSGTINARLNSVWESFDIISRLNYKTLQGKEQQLSFLRELPKNIPTWKRDLPKLEEQARDGEIGVGQMLKAEQHLRSLTTRTKRDIVNWFGVIEPSDIDLTRKMKEDIERLVEVPPVRPIPDYWEKDTIKTLENPPLAGTVENRVERLATLINRTKAYAARIRQLDADIDEAKRGIDVEYAYKLSRSVKEAEFKINWIHRESAPTARAHVVTSAVELYTWKTLFNHVVQHAVEKFYDANKPWYDIGKDIDWDDINTYTESGKAILDLLSNRSDQFDEFLEAEQTTLDLISDTSRFCEEAPRIAALGTRAEMAEFIDESGRILESYQVKYNKELKAFDKVMDWMPPSWGPVAKMLGLVDHFDPSRE